jgi:curved DNA-binding protein
MADFKDYYEILGVDKKADQDEIRRAFRKLAAKHHPDRNPDDPQAEERFKEINEAYTALSDPEKRKIYDTYGRTGQVPPQQGGWTGTGPGGARVWTNVDPDQAASFSDFFQSLFGGFGGFGGFEQAAGPRGGVGDPFREMRTGARVARPRNVEGDLELEIERAYHGGDVPISVGGRRVTVTVPKGVHPGAKLRLRGQAPGGGDLLLKVRLKPHPRFELIGDDVHSTARIPDHLAALGGSATVDTLDGRVDVTVPPGSSSGRTLRLRGQGWPRSGGGRGDQLVELQVTVPERLDERQERLYRELREAARHGRAEQAAAEGD